MDVLDTHAVIGEALRRAREERRPLLVEAITYRFRGHSMADPEEYRTKEQVAEWRKRDPIVTFGDAPRGRGRAGRRRPRQQLDAEAIARVDEAVAFADASPFPPPESLYDDVYVLGDQVRGWYSVDERSAGVHRGEDERKFAQDADGGGDRRRATGEVPQEITTAIEAGRGGLMAATTERSAPAGSGTPVVRYREALNEALREEMQRDERVLLMGEDIGVFHGAFKVTEGLLEEFGEKRVRDTPISENTIVGMGVGAAMAGLRPVVELMTINFSLLAIDQIVNHAAHDPLHVRRPGRACRSSCACRRARATSSGRRTRTRFEALYLHVPGLLVAVPSTAADAKGLLKAAIRDDNPVIFIEHEYLYGQRGEVPEGDDHLVRLRARPPCAARAPT